MYSDDFEDCELSTIPKYISPMSGAFDCVDSSSSSPSPSSFSSQKGEKGQHGGGDQGAKQGEGQQAIYKGKAKGKGKGRALRQVAPAMAICDRGDVMPYAVLGDGFRTTYNVSIDFLLPPPPTEGGGGGRGEGEEEEEAGVFVGARAKGPVGALTAMSGVFLAVNSTGYRVALSIGNLTLQTKAQHHASSAAASTAGSAEGGGAGWPTVLLEGVLPAAARGHGLWRRVSLAVEGTTARATVDSGVLFEELTVPSPQEHYTSIVAKHIVPLGKGGYAAFGTVGYSAAEFDNLYVSSSS